MWFIKLYLAASHLGRQVFQDLEDEVDDYDVTWILPTKVYQELGACYPVSVYFSLCDINLTVFHYLFMTGIPSF